MKSWFTFLPVLALAACALPGRQGTPAPAVYDLGLPAGRLAEADRLPFTGIEVKAPKWMDTVGIEYRLAYAEPGQIRHYAEARWASSPAALLQQRLGQQLGMASQVKGQGGCLLRVDLDRFSQWFETPSENFGVLQARVSLLEQGRHKVAEQTVLVRKPSPSPDSRGGVAALVEVAGQLGQDIARWQGALPAGQLGACARRDG